MSDYASVDDAATVQVVGSVNVGFSDAFSIGVKAADSNALPTDDTSFALAFLQTDTVAAQSEALQFGFPAGNFGDSSSVPSDAPLAAIRVWGSGSSDNDSSQTTPANANGQNDGTFAVVKTNNSVGDLTNPVTLTSAAFASAPAGTYTSKLIRVYFNVPARALTADTLTMSYNIGAGDVTIYTHAGTAAVDHNAGTFTFDISGLTVAECQALTLKANYLAAIVAVPETRINLDAWAIELVRSF